MKIPFSLKPLPRIIFGEGRLRQLPDVIVPYGKNILLLTGAGSFIGTENYHILRQLFHDHGITVFHETVTGEPSPQMVDNIVKRYDKNAIDAVAAVGGGSVLDCGKAVSAMLPKGQGVEGYLEGVGHVEPDGGKIPFIAVPTTSGTGSEVTSNAVISRVGPDGYKKSLRHDNYIPNAAIIDPLLTSSCPAAVAISCSLDAFSQLVESFLSTGASPFTDDIAFGAIKRLRESLPPVCEGTGTAEDRCNMSYGAMTSGITLANAGLGVVHGFASVIGGHFSIPHGVVCGTLMGAANEVTLQRLRLREDSGYALTKYTDLGRLFSSESKKSDQYYQDSFIAYLHQLTAELDVPPLNRFGITQEDLAWLAESTGSKNNPVQLDIDAKIQLLDMRLN